MPENGTSLINEIFKPVKKPSRPSYQLILIIASIKPLYSLNPRTSSLVFITIRGLHKVDQIRRAKAEAVEFTVFSEKILNQVNKTLKQYKVLKQVPEFIVFFTIDGKKPL